MGTTRTLSMPEHSGKAPYVVLKRTDGQYWDNTNTALGAYDGNSWADYAIDMSENDANGASGDFTYTVPADLPSGTYDEAVYLKGSDNAATLLDQHAGEGSFDWNGTKIAGLSDFALAGTIDAGSVTPTDQKVALDSEFPNRDDALNGAALLIVHGTKDHEVRRVLDYTGSTRVCELSAPLTKTPAGGETVYVLGRIE